MGDRGVGFHEEAERLEARLRDRGVIRGEGRNFGESIEDAGAIDVMLEGSPHPFEGLAQAPDLVVTLSSKRNVSAGFDIPRCR
jgi:hypothetical protein